MITVDWAGFYLGLLAGVPVSILYFAGLALGIRMAPRVLGPTAVLLLSAMCRLIMLLGVGFWIASAGKALWPVIAYGLAFLLVRFAALHYAWTAYAPIILMEKKTDAAHSR